MIRLKRSHGPVIAAGILVLFALGIAASTLFWIGRSYSALPYWDQWETVVEYGRLRQGDLRFADLFSQHNEHRIAFPRLVFLTDYVLFKGRNLFCLAVILAFQLLHAALLVRLIGDLRRPLMAAGAALVFALLLSIGQWENFVWGFQVQFVDVFAMATAAYILLAKAAGARTPLGRLGLWTACAACLGVAVFSMANGLAAVAIAAVLAIAMRARRWMIAGLVGLLVALSLAYFHNYTPVADRPTAAYALAHPFDFVTYVAAYLGNIAGPLTLRPTTALLYDELSSVPVWLGFLGLAASAGALARVVRRKGVDRTELVLLGVIAFIGATAALTALGRLSFGLDQAYSSRYVTPAGVFWAAQTVFWVRAAAPGPTWAKLALGAALAGIAGLLCWVQLRVPLFVMRHSENQRLAEDALLSGLDDGGLSAAYARPQELMQRAQVLRRYGVSIYAARQAHWLGRPIAALAPAAKPTACIGAFDVAQVPAENPRFSGRAAGWGWDRAGHRPAERVVLTNEQMRIVGFGSLVAERPDVPKAVRGIYTRYVGWNAVTRADGGMQHAFLILNDGSACEIGARPLGIATSRLIEISKADVGDPLATVSAQDAAWTRNGVGPAPESVKDGKPSNGEVFGSWSGDDAKSGEITFGPLTTTDPAIALGLITGPDSTGQSLILKDAETGVVYAELKPAVRLEWTWRRMRIPPQAAGRPLILQGRDGGIGHGQWMAMTPPRKFVTH